MKAKTELQKLRAEITRLQRLIREASELLEGGEA